MAATTDIFAGFIPLTDAAILVAARERGFAEEEGVNLNLVRETSWANIRDRMAIGQFQAAIVMADPFIQNARQPICAIDVKPDGELPGNNAIPSIGPMHATPAIKDAARLAALVNTPVVSLLSTYVVILDSLLFVHLTGTE